MVSAIFCSRAQTIAHGAIAFAPLRFVREAQPSERSPRGTRHLRAVQGLGRNDLVRAAVTALTALLIACRPGLGGLVTPSPTAQPECAAVPSFTAPIEATYAKDLLETQQRIIAGGVGTDRLAPTEPALEYLSGLGLANDKNTRSFDTHLNADGTALVRLCMNDGSVIEASMYRPFPNEPRPIWAVSAYRVGR